MKNLSLKLLLLLLTPIIGYAQTTVVQNLERPVSIIKYGNDLYISEISEGIISKVAFEDLPSESTTLGLEINGVGNMVLVDDNIYLNSDEGIKKVNLTNLEVEDIFTIQNSFSIGFFNNTLYFSNYGELLKIDLQDPTLTVTTLLDSSFGLSNISDIEFYNSIMYVSDIGLNKIYRIDNFESEPNLIELVSGIGGVNDLLFHQNFLYYSESTADKISRVNLNSNELIPESILEDLDFPNGKLIIDDVMYICNSDNGEILSFEDIPTSIFEFPTQEKLLIYPNPAIDKCIIENLDHNESIRIYDLYGNLIFNSILDTNELNLDWLEKGIYTILTDKNKVVKLCKLKNK